MAECARLESGYTLIGIEGSNPSLSANLQFQCFVRCLPRGFATRLARCARKELILKGFATLRAAKRKCFGFGLGSSNQSFLENPDPVRDFLAKR